MDRRPRLQLRGWTFAALGFREYAALGFRETAALDFRETAALGFRAIGELMLASCEPGRPAGPQIDQ